MTTTSAPPVASLPTLLVCDDEEGPRQSLRMVFRKDFQVVTVDNGDAALAYAKANRVNVAILDIRMAGKTGIDVLRGLKAIDPHVEIIMLTAYETIETARQALRLGACDYLSKPFDLSGIREAVGRAMHLHQISETVTSSSERLKQLSNQLHDTSLREEMAKTTTEVYAGALHDINNPLSVITGYVEILQNRLEGARSLHGSDLDAVRSSIAVLSKQVATCTAIAKRYLRFINKRAAAAEVSVNQVLEDVQTLMRNHPSARRSQLAIKHLNVDTTATIASTELIQILLNLTINAFQSTPEPQTVWITAERYEIKLPVAEFQNSDQEMTLGLETFANHAPLVALSVLDQGPGIPASVLPRIFEAYFTTKAEGGTGLGLAITARLVRAHHGMIHVKTSPVEGTRFTLYLPAKDSASSQQPFPAAKA